MKQIFITFLAVLITVSVFAQTPQKMTYQAVIRNGSNNLVTNTNIGIQVSILHSSVTGNSTYTERHFPTTNNNGLVTLEIGTGTVISGDFSSIDWANDIYFVKTEIDLNGGANYTITSVNQLLSVPYALHAKTAESIIGGINESDPIFINSQASNITANDITNLNNLSGINTGDQDISGIATNTQAIQDTASQIRADIPDVTGFISTEVDGDVNNEIQSLSVSTTGDTLFLSSSNWVIIPGISSANTSTIQDIDGNVYQIVEIGNQTWMAENIRTTHYADNTAISGYVYPNNDVNNVTEYGLLYDRATATRDDNSENNVQGVCPDGWHIPNNTEWDELSNYLGGNNVSGGKMKAVGLTYWNTPNESATNSSNFNGKGSGAWNTTNGYGSFKERTYMWSSTSPNSRALYYNSETLGVGSHASSDKLSVRCIMD